MYIKKMAGNKYINVNIYAMNKYVLTVVPLVGIIKLRSGSTAKLWNSFLEDRSAEMSNGRKLLPC